MQLDELVHRLGAAGCVAAHEEAEELTAAARQQNTPVETLLRRRETGEPLAWITGNVKFCGLDILVAPDVYVPRWQSEALALAAADALGDTGIGIDLCTGSGAIAAVMKAAKPNATVLATDIDPLSVTTARTNGINARSGDLFDSLPPGLRGCVDVVVAVVPYVPSDELHLLPRDTIDFEPRSALDGGTRGLQVFARVVEQAGAWLRPNGRALLEIGGEQADPAAELLRRNGFAVDEVMLDEDGDVRGIAATWLDADARAAK